MLQYKEIEVKLPELKERGFIRTHRAGNTGIGKTLEDELGIEENNFAGPNGHMTELKSSRKGGSSMVTLFTKSPLPKAINRKLVDKLGKLSNGKKVLHTTMDATSRNALYGKPGFMLTVHDTRIEIDHPNYGDLPTPYWNSTDLKASFIRKYPKNLLYVKADTIGRGINESFHYNEAWLMSGFGFENFVNLLKKGKILVDIRIGKYPDGKMHDHGTGFRVKPEDLDLCFSNREQVL